jgi:hypothetical protein
MAILKRRLAGICALTPPTLRNWRFPWREEQRNKNGKG